MSFWEGQNTRGLSEPNLPLCVKATREATLRTVNVTTWTKEKTSSSASQSTRNCQPPTHITIPHILHESAILPFCLPSTIDAHQAKKAHRLTSVPREPPRYPYPSTRPIISHHGGLLRGRKTCFCRIQILLFLGFGGPIAIIC